jgi:hypothetical protein
VAGWIFSEIWPPAAIPMSQAPRPGASHPHEPPYSPRLFWWQNTQVLDCCPVTHRMLPQCLVCQYRAIILHFEVHILQRWFLSLDEFFQSAHVCEGGALNFERVCCQVLLPSYLLDKDREHM